MTIYQFNLSTTEPNNSIGLIRVRQDDDESQIFKVTIYENGSPKNLTGVFAEFNMVDAKDHVIVDEAYITDGPNGLVEYHLNKAAMQSVGRCKAYFSFKNEDDVLFSTKDFSYNVIWSALSHPLHHGCDYVWTIADLIENLKDYIEHAMGDFDDWFESVKDILASIDPGGVILKELLDARHSTPFDMKHSTLKERLDYTDALVKRLEELENSFDLATLEPMFVSNLATRRNAVLQAFCIDTKTSQYYAAQSDSQTPEGFVISQISPAGSKLLSTMNFPNSGHGTTFGMEREKDTIYIWTITNNCADEQRLIRVPYVKNSTLDYSTDLKDYTPASLKNIYFTPVVDMLHNTMLIRRGDGLCELRHLDDIKNGIDKVLYSVQVPITENNDDRPMQGAVSHGTTLYWYSGWSTNAVKVFKYDMVSKKLLITREFEFPNETGNGFTDDYREPEGLAYYINPYTGKESLLMGITSGDSIKRYQMIYAIHQRGAQEHFDSLRALESQNYAYFRGDGRAHGIPTGLTKLSDLRRTGVYYLTAEMGALLTDLPSPQFKNAGIFVENKPGEQHDNLRQIVTRSSYSRKNLSVERMLDYDGSAGIWSTRSSVSSQQEYIAAADYDYQLSNVILPDTYYITTPQAKLFKDHPEKDGESGWFFEVLSGDSAGNSLQRLTKNSSTRGHIHQRMNNGISSWIATRAGQLDYVKIPLVPAIASEVEELRVANQGNYLIIRGKTKINFKDNDGAIFANLPEGYRPNFYWEQICALGGTTGYTKVTVNADGRMNFYGLDAVNEPAITSVYMYLTIPIF